VAARPLPPSVPAGPLKIDSAIDLALQNFPSIRAAAARKEAAQSGVDLARTSYLPRLDFLWQEIRATRNNFSGTLIPNYVINSLSGPVSPRSWDSAWGSAGGVLLSYEPIDFGYRGATVDVARSGESQARADLEVTRLDVAGGAAQAFLALLAAREAARAAGANVDRWTVFARAVRTLADQQLRPGADASRADAELALARNQLIQAEEVVATGRITLAEALGTTDPTIEIDPGPFLGLPVRTELSWSDLVAHPLLRRQEASLETIQARQRALDSAYYPRINLQAGANARGSGFGAGGDFQGGDEGLWPDRGNWFAGVSFTFPSMEFFQLRARSRAEEANERAERARTDEIILGLTMQGRRVQAILDAARKIAQNTPVQLKAAQDAHASARARYDSGLGTITEVAEAQRLLAQGEIDDAVARLGIWRALALAIRTQGDAGPFLKIVSDTPKQEK
jgi:outer membrane protein TolC